MLNYMPWIISLSLSAIVGIILPLAFLRAKNRSLIQLSLVLTAVIGWLFWACSYMSQMNPLFGPRLSNMTILIVDRLQKEREAPKPVTWKDILPEIL